MKTMLGVDALWIPPSHGGRRTEPHPGLRLGIRWQRHIQEHTDLYRDMEIEQLTMDPSTRQGTVVLKISNTVPIPSEWLVEGELLELLEGFKVVAVARIVGVR